MTSSTPCMIVAIILAGGKGTRLKSDLPKVMQPLLGKSLIYRVLATLSELSKTATPIQKAIVVVGHQLDLVMSHIQSESWPFEIEFVEQTPQLGTGHAVQQALKALPADTDARVLITCGDMPLVRPTTYALALEAPLSESAPLALITTHMATPTGYGRVLRGDNNAIRAIVEERDATTDEKATQWVNTGIYSGLWSAVAGTLGQLQNTNTQQEYYLTDIVSILNSQGKSTLAVETQDETEMLGINSRSDLAEAADVLSSSHIQTLMASGVSFINPKTSTVSPEVSIAPDTTVYPGCTLLGDVSIGPKCLIGPHTTLIGTHGAIAIAEECEVIHSTLERGVSIGAKTVVGPYAHLRDETVIGRQCKIGNFVEIKQTQMGNLSNAAHLSYLGDATVGDNVNMGAGSIIANYDPIRDEKHQTLIGNDVKVGCNSTLISPIQLADSSCVAAGSTINERVETDTLAIARPRQSSIPGWVSKTQGKALPTT